MGIFVNILNTFQSSTDKIKEDKIQMKFNIIKCTSFIQLKMSTTKILQVRKKFTNDNIEKEE